MLLAYLNQRPVDVIDLSIPKVGQWKRSLESIDLTISSDLSWDDKIAKLAPKARGRQGILCPKSILGKSELLTA